MKKRYIKPQTAAIYVELQQMLADSDPIIPTSTTPVNPGSSDAKRFDPWQTWDLDDQD